jgi:hypothetical protein
MQNYSIVTPESLVYSIYNDRNRDCHYNHIIKKVIEAYPNLTDYRISSLEDYADRLHNDATERFERENVGFFRNNASMEDFEYACESLCRDVCINDFERKEMYEFSIESSVFMDAHYCRTWTEYKADDDHDRDNEMSFREQSDADRSDYAQQFSCPIQRAEIRAGA